MSVKWTKNPKTGLWEEDQTAANEAAEWDKFIKSSYASAAAKDIYSVNQAMPKAVKSFENERYALGGGNALKNDNTLFNLKFAKEYSPIAQKSLEEGRNYLDMSDEEFQTYIEASKADSNLAKELLPYVIARTGGLGSIDMTGMPRAQQRELGYMDNLYGFDMAPGQLSAAVPEDSGSKRAGVDTYQDLHSKQMAYSKKQAEKDLKVLDARFNALYANPGMQFDSKSDSKFYDAASRLSDYYGVDMSIMPADFSGDWSKRMLEKYDADTESLRSIVPEYDDYAEYDQAHAHKAKQDEMAAAKGLQLKGEASVLEDASEDIEGYADKSQYIPGEAYWHPSHADYNILVGNSMPEEGDYLSANDRQARVKYSFLNDYIAASAALSKNPEDEAARKKLSEMDGVANNVPYLRTLDLRALPYMDDSQRETFYRYYNNKDFAAVDDYLGKINYDIAKKAFEAEKTAHEADLADNTFGENVLNYITAFPRNLVASWAQNAYLANQWLNAFGIEVGDQDYIHEYNELFKTGQEVDMDRAALGQQITDATSGLTIPENIPVIGGKNIANMGYQALTSLGDLWLSKKLGGNWFTSASMFGREGGDTVREAQIAGNPNALLYGTGAGAWSALVEYFGGDELAASNAWKAATGEGTEELITGAGQNVWDLIVNRENSGLIKTFDEYVRKGYADHAKWATAEDTASDLVEQYAVGFGAGGAPAAVNATVQGIENRKRGENLRNNEALEEVINLAETLPMSDKSKGIIERMKAERAEQAKNEKAQTEDKASVTKEDADAFVQEAEKNAEQNARERAERADEGKPGETVDPAAITKEDAEQTKNREQAAQARKAAAQARKAATKNQKPVTDAELGYVYREVMNNVDKGAQQAVTEAFSRDVVETELAASGYRGDMRWAADVVTKFINGNTGKNIIKALESNEVVRQVALDFMGDVQAIRAEYRSKADNIAQRASKDFVKPETAKAEKGAQEATQGIDDRAAVAEDDVFAMTDEDIDVEIAEAEESTVDGKAVTIEGVAKVAEDGSVTYNVKDADGNVSEVAEGDVAYGQNDGNVARLVAMAKDLGKNAETLLRSYAEGQDVYEYTAAFKQAMQYGEDGRNIDVVKGYSDMQSLNEGQIAAAYELGRGIRTQRNNAMVRKNVSGITVGKVDTSGVDFKSLTKHQRTAVHTMSRLAKAAGFNIKFVESKANAEGKYTTENGSWDPRTLTLTLDVHAGSNSTTDTNYAMMHTAGHELTHYIRQFADGDLWNAYQEFVVGHLSKKDGKAFDLETKIQNGMKRGLDRDAAIEEVIADASGEALNSITEADIQALADTNPGLLNKVKQFISRWIKSVKAAIKAAYQGTEAKTEAAKQMMDAVDEMGKRWNELLVNATKNKAAGNVASETTIPGVEVSESGDTAYAGTGNDSVNVVSEKTPAQNEQQSLSYTHIDQRTFDSVADTDTELFCSEVDEAQIGMAAAANILLADLENSMPGQKVWLADGEVSGQKRQTSELLGRMKDDLGLTWDGLKQRLQQFAGMETSEQLPKNNLNNRRIELYLHEMLTEGYTALDGTKVNAWDGYIDSMQGFEGADAQKKYSPIAGAVDFADYAWPGEVKYSPRLLKSEVVAVQSIGKKSVNVFNSEEIRKTEGLARRYLKEIGAKSPFFRAWFGDWRAYDTTEVQTANIPGKERGAVANEDTGWEIQISRKVFNETRNHKQGANVKAKPYLEYINDIVKKAVLLDSVGMEIGKTKSENSLMMHSLYAVADIGDGPNLLKLYIEEMNDVNSENTGKRSYQLQNIENQRLNVIGSGKSLATSISTADVKSVADLVKVVKRAGDLQDSKTVNPKMLNPDGTPKVMYHGSPSKFNVFDKRKAKSSGLYGRGFYFTDSKSHGSTYGELYEVYLSIKHPITPGGDSVTRSQVRKFLEAVAENEDDYSIENYGTYDIDEILRNVYRKDAFAVIQDVSATAIGDMVEAVKLFNDVNGTDFDGIVVDTETVAFEPTQIKSATNNIGTFDPENPDIRYSTRDYDELSDRELLVQALETELTPAERDHLERYKKKVDGLGADQTRMEELTSRIVELRKAGYTARTSEELRAAETNVATLRKRIDRKDKELKGIESADMIREIVRRNRAEARKQAYTLARQRADERQRKAVEHAREVGERRVQRMKESQAKEKYKKRILDDSKKLMTWATSPTAKDHVPQFMRRPLLDFFEAINFSSNRALKGGEETNADKALMSALDALRRSVEENEKGLAGFDDGVSEFVEFIDLPEGFANSIDELVYDFKKGEYKTVHKKGFAENIADIKGAFGEYASMDNDGITLANVALNHMTSAQLKRLAEITTTLRTSIRNINVNLANSRYTSNKEMSKDGINEMNGMKAKMKTNKALEVLNSTFNWKNATPFMAFQRLGRAGKAVFEGLQDGWDKMARNSAKLIDYAEKAFNEKESKVWSSEITEVTLDSEDTIQMTTAQKMSLYCHTKREQSRGHLMGGGIRVSDIAGKRGTKITQAENYVLTEADIERIIDSLTARQIEVADALQAFMNGQCAEWGNEISMKRFGYEQMTEKHYFPIKTDSNNRASIDESKDGSTSMFRLLNMSSLKPLTPGANNAIIIEDIFNVFSDHASDMAKYNALALPILDFIKWYNFVEKSAVVGADGKPTGQHTTRSTRKALERVFGKNADEYLRSFIKDLNAEHDGGRNDGLINSIVGRAKSAAVGANLRVYGLQITSLPRAAYAIDAKYLIKGLAKWKSLNPMNAKNGTEAQDEVGILLWKKLGFFSTDTSRSVREMVKRDKGFFGKLRDAQMEPAGWGDNWVSNIIYEAAKAELADKHKDLKPGTDAYKKALNDRVREIVYKTQVVDSTMTRSDLMRSKGLASMTTAFMSEPTLTINMLNESIQKAVETGRKGGSTRDILRATGGMAVRAAVTWTVTSFITAMVESAFDGLRDDDEYETFLEKFNAAFKGNMVDNLNPITMLPILNEAWSILVEGYEDSSLMTQVLSQGKSFMDAIKSYKKGNTTLYNVIYKGAQTTSSMGGVGVSNAMRDFTGLYNTFFAPAWGTPKLQTYADTESTAAEAYYNAVTEGRTEDAEYYMDRMQVNELDMEKVNKKLVSLAGDGFVAGNVSEADTRKWLNDAGYTKDKTEDKIRDMQFKKETGVNYSDFKSAYVDGTFSKTEATRLLKKYRGYDDNKVYFTLQEWDGDEDWTKYGAFLDAVDNRSGYAAEAKKLLDHGVEKGDIASAIAKAYKEAYREIHGTQAGDLMLEYLLDVYEAIGYDRDYERKYITKNWIK